MKYLLVLLVVVIAIGIWRSKHRSLQTPQRPRQPSPPSSPQSMTACAYCGLHLPTAEAITSTAGHTFCSEEHRLLAQKNPPQA